MRSCLGCGRVDAQSGLIRLVRDADGQLRVDSIRQAGGRGGYLHPEASCWTHFAQRKGMVRSFRAAVDRPMRAALVEQWNRGVEQ